jgi:acyl-CoA dehydrogenase
MTPAERKLLVDTVTSLLAARTGNNLIWDEPLWSELSAAGFTAIGHESADPEDLAAATAIVAAAASRAAAVPLAEHLLLALPACRIADFSCPIDPAAATTLATGSVLAESDGSAWLLYGVASDAPWASVSALVVAVIDIDSKPGLALVPTRDLSIETSVNIAGEPRDQIRFEATEALEVRRLTDDAVGELRSRYALARAVQISGALRRILDLTVAYARQREQFGRPIFEFQAIRSHLAVMAGEVEATEAIVGAAAETTTESAEFRMLAAAAKVRAGMAVDAVTRSAHQVHGAIGLTQEYPLHSLTRRCWAWRDEAGSTNHWSRVIARALLESDELWPALSRL